MHTRKVAGPLCLMFLTFACASGSPPNQQPPTPQITSQAAVPITDEQISRSRGQMQISGVSEDPAYGYTEATAIKIGGGFEKGSERTYQYLNSLRSSQGKTVRYSRVGTCCPFKTSNSPFGDEALLEVYEIQWPNAKQTKRLYFNWYDAGPVMVPAGLAAAN